MKILIINSVHVLFLITTHCSSTVRQLVDMDNTDFDHIVIGKYLHKWVGVKNVENGYMAGTPTKGQV